MPTHPWASSHLSCFPAEIRGLQWRCRGKVCVPSSAAAWWARCGEAAPLPAAGPNPSSTSSFFPGLSWGWCQGTPTNQTIIQQNLPVHWHQHLQFPLREKWPIFANKTLSISPQVLLWIMAGWPKAECWFMTWSGWNPIQAAKAGYAHCRFGVVQLQHLGLQPCCHLVSPCTAAGHHFKSEVLWFCEVLWKLNSPG